MKDLYSNLVNFNEAAHQVGKIPSKFHVLGAQGVYGIIEATSSHHRTRVRQKHIL